MAAAAAAAAALAVATVEADVQVRLLDSDSDCDSDCGRSCRLVRHGSLWRVSSGASNMAVAMFNQIRDLISISTAAPTAAAA